MNRFLATKPKLFGISKQSIMWVILVTIIVLAIIMIFWPEHSKSNGINDKDINISNIQSKNDDIDSLMKLISQDKSNKNSNNFNVSGSVPNISDVKDSNEIKKIDNNKLYSSKILMYITERKNIDNKEHLKDDNKDNLINNKLIDKKSILKAGSIIPSLMVNGINSDIPGDVIAIVRDNIYDSITRQYILIPQGAKLVGKYDSNVVYAQDRLAVFWNKLIYPNGRTINLDGVRGSDLSGYSGLYDQVDNHYLRIFGASFVMGVITGAMQYSQSNSYNNQSLTAGQVMSNSLGQQMGQTSLAIVNKNINVKPTIVIRPNYPFNIMIVSDLNLDPYNN